MVGAEEKDRRKQCSEKANPAFFFCVSISSPQCCTRHDALGVGRRAAVQVLLSVVGCALKELNCSSLSLDV